MSLDDLSEADPRKALERELEAEQKLARVRKLLEEHDLELDETADAIISSIVKGAVYSGVGKFITRDWMICQAIKFWRECPLPATKQRAFEYIGELQGLSGNGAGSKKDGLVADVVIGELQR